MSDKDDDDFAEALAVAFAELLARQEPLGEPFTSILNKHCEELYEYDTPPTPVTHEMPERMFASHGYTVDNGKVTRVNIPTNALSSRFEECNGPLWVRADAHEADVNALRQEIAELTSKLQISHGLLASAHEKLFALSAPEVVSPPDVEKWQRALAAQSRKLQHLLDAIPEARDVLQSAFRDGILPNDPATMTATPAMVTAALQSRARDDEGEFPPLIDLLDFSGENKARTVARAALEAAFATFGKEN